MKALRAFDLWIGKTLFVPPIIRFCQWSGMSQHRLHRLCWFAAMLVAVYFATGFWMKAFFGLLALISCLVAALLPDDFEERSRRGFRLLVIGVTFLLIPLHDWHLAYNLLILIAEYAATIRTIPPLEENKPAADRLIEVKATRL